MLKQLGKTRVAGIGLALVLGAMVALTGALYAGALADPATLTLQTERAGLVMDPGNKVKMRGIEIGKVGDVERADDLVEIVLEIDRDHFGDVPNGVTAEIRASTIFGAKYVELVPPPGATGHIEDGAVIAASGVTVEVNTVFQSLDRVLSGVDIASLNRTLTVLSQALSGRGSEIAATAQQADAYLAKLEPLLPRLRRTLVEVAETSRLGVEISPALMRILRNATVTAGTVNTHQKALHRLLLDLSLLGDHATKLLQVNGDALATLLRTLRLPASTLRAYSSELPCLLMGLDRTRDIIAKAIGGTDPTLRALVSIRSELPKHTYPRDLPGYPSGRGPDCHGLPVVSPGAMPVPERGPVQ